MAPQKKDKMTEYERKRLENIRRNHQMIASLNIHYTLSQLSSHSSSSSSNKRSRAGASSKSYKVSPEKKPKSTSPIVIRRSLRARGMPPDSKGLFDNSPEPPIIPPHNESGSPQEEKPSPRVLGPYSMRDAYSGEPGSDRALIDTIMSVEKKPEIGFQVKREFAGEKVVKEGQFDGFCGDFVEGEVKSEELDGSAGFKWEKRDVVESCLDLESMSLEPENVARVVPGRITAVKFFPCNNVRMVAVGNRFGNVGFWNADYRRDEGGEGNDGIYLYRPHTAPVSGILFQQCCSSKIFTSSYDGFLRLLDAEKEVFDLVHHSEDTIFSLSQKPNDVNSLYFGEGHGGLIVLDDRAKSSSKWMLHEDRINSIDFNSQNPNIMVTSSTDGTVCIWDLRSVNADKPNCLKTVSHNRAVYSAYFSPSGSMLATTSVDDNVGLLSGVNFDDTAMIYHNNQTGRWLSTFRATWGWDDSFVFIGNMKRAIDVISPADRRVIMTLESSNMSAIPCRFDPHPFQVGMLAGATSGGQVYIWTAS